MERFNRFFFRRPRAARGTSCGTSEGWKTPVRCARAQRCSRGIPVPSESNRLAAHAAALLASFGIALSLYLAVVLAVVLTLSAALYAGKAQADEVGCINADIISGKLITDICWECVFPIKVAGVAISGSDDAARVPDGAAIRPFCMCWDNLGAPKPGVTTSFWQPNRLAEYQRVSGCSSVLNGIRFPFDRLNQGTQNRATEKPNDNFTFRHYHYYAFPVMLMLDIFVPGHCNPGAFHDLDVMYMSEVDPTWSSDELAFFANPEAALVATPLAATACIPDAVAANVSEPVKELYWCAGSWGMLYPFTGNVLGRDGILRTTSLMATRTLAALHRRGLEWLTVGDEVMCGGEIAPFLPKNQYRFTVMYPTPETDDSHVIGESDLLWGMGRVLPAVGEDPVYLVWRWLDCCNT